MAVKILVVDDEPDLEVLVRQIFRKRIQDDELQFTFANNGAQALDKLAADSQIDCVLTDINMPEMDGLTLLTKLNELYASHKAVIVSAYGDMANIRTAMNRGAFDFLIKPIDFEDLEITINRTLQELESLKQAAQNREQLQAIQQELNIASQIQQSILPRDFALLPAGAGFAIHAEMNPAKEVGGDFYDFFLIDPERAGFVIGDVSGKGVPAAIFMAMARTLLKSTALKGVSPSACLHDLNKALVRDNARGMFVTVLYGVLNTRTGDLVYCNGGHNPPFLIRGGSAEVLEKVGGMIVGAIDQSEYKEKSIALQPGDALFLYTDGVTEAMDADGNLFSEARLKQILQAMGDATPSRLIREVTAAVKTYAGDAPQADDITALAIRFR